MFSKALVLGGGFAGKLAAMSLDKQNIKVTLVEQTPITPETLSRGENLMGKLAHSHIFLPRLLKDANRILPEWIDDMEREALDFEPGMRRAGNDLVSQRLFATRWQLEATLQNRLNATPEIACVRDSFTQAQLGLGQEKLIKTVTFRKSGLQNLTPDTLVVDAMGGASPLMKHLTEGASGIIQERSFVCYITQFFKFEDGKPRLLPDALDSCSWKQPDWFMSLYPAANGWFSVTVVIDARNQTLKKELSRGDNLKSLAVKHKQISRWLQEATPIGEPKLFLDPKNTWFLAPFSEGIMPSNFCALGDALITTSPVLGAGCSFAVTHVAEMLGAIEQSNWHDRFAKAVAQQQEKIFAESLAYHPPNGTEETNFNAMLKLRTALRNLPGISGIRQRRALASKSTL